MGCVVIVDGIFYRPDTNVVESEVKQLLIDEWKKDPNVLDFKVERVELTNKGGREFRGFVNAILNGKKESIGIEVTRHDDRLDVKLLGDAIPVPRKDSWDVWVSKNFHPILKNPGVGRGLFFGICIAWAAIKGLFAMFRGDNS
jgi:hypothetical protein